MTLRRSFLVVASAALAIALIALFIKIGRINVRTTLQQLQSVTWISFAKIAMLNVILVYLSTAKWRSIDAAWRRPSDSVPSRTTSFAITSAGLALGVVLPVQIAMSTARTLGTYVHGGAVKRGTAGTLLEQGFDVFTVAFLAVASGITWLSHGEAMTFTLSAAAALALALLAVEPSIRLIRWLAVRLNASAAVPNNRILRSLWELQHSPLLNAALARRLVVLSALRFVVVVAMSIETAEAVGLHFPPWQMAAAIPFVVIASIIGVTPGGLGVNELALAGALEVFGTPFTIGAQWALANRVIVAASYFFVAACAATLLGARRITAPGTPGPMRNRP
jgi:hypothetical protein